MEVHAGSIDEEDDEQGIAHMIEHVAFLGSKKREKLLGTGARSNAYTDFHHTVFHIHSPTSTKVGYFDSPLSVECVEFMFLLTLLLIKALLCPAQTKERVALPLTFLSSIFNCISPLT